MGQGFTQLYGIAFRIAIERGGKALSLRHQISNERWRGRIGIFIGIELVGHSELRRTIGGLAAQFLAQGKICQLRHLVLLESGADCFAVGRQPLGLRKGDDLRGNFFQRSSVIINEADRPHKGVGR